MMKVPFILLAGGRDAEASTVSFRFRDGSQQNDVPLAEAKALILDAISQKKQV
jgi:threonyl-tRNA synthetase